MQKKFTFGSENFHGSIEHNFTDDLLRLELRIIDWQPIHTAILMRDSRLIAMRDFKDGICNFVTFPGGDMELILADEEDRYIANFNLPYK
jgi:hypothetical protein